MQVAVLGCGTIGQSWVSLFLACGFRVKAYDPDPSAELRVRDHIARFGGVLADLGYTCPHDATHLQFTTDASDSVRGVEFIQENAPENLSSKQHLFHAIAPTLDADAIIASSTSGLILDALQDIAPNPERIVIGHPFNPPHLIPLVEVIGNTRTAPDVLERVMDLYRHVGKSPVALKRSVPGHVANRLQAVLWQEVIHLAKEGVASLAEIDQILADGPGLRWSLYGPNTLFSMAAGDRGIEGFITHLGPSFEAWWQDAGQVVLDSQTQAFIAEQMASWQGGAQIDDLSTIRDRHLLRMLKARRADPLQPVKDPKTR